MSQTVIVGEAERDRRFENRLNVVVRHCRIGKVTSKRKAPISNAWPLISPLPNTIPFHDFVDLGRMSKCGCKVGDVCMNAACPHAVRVTC